jgi:hypothetical protein
VIRGRGAAGPLNGPRADDTIRAIEEQTVSAARRRVGAPSGADGKGGECGGHTAPVAPESRR